MASGRVFSIRTTPLVAADLPAVEVRIAQEEAAGVSIHRPQFRPMLALLVEPMTLTGPGAEDVLDALAKDIEEALFGDPSWVHQWGAFASMTTTFSTTIRDGIAVMSAPISIRGTVGDLVVEPRIVDDFRSVDAGLDLIDPGDPNSGQSGPDGRIEIHIPVTLSTD